MQKTVIARRHNKYLNTAYQMTAEKKKFTDKMAATASLQSDQNLATTAQSRDVSPLLQKKVVGNIRGKNKLF